MRLFWVRSGKVRICRVNSGEFRLFRVRSVRSG